MTLPQVEKEIKGLLKGHVVSVAWRKGLDIIMEAENDAAQAVEAIRNFKEKSTKEWLTI